MTRGHDPHRFHLRLFRLLLRAFPRRFRDLHGEGMEELFLDEIHEARRRSAGSEYWFLARAALDMTLSGLRERGVRSSRQTASLSGPGREPTRTPSAPEPPSIGLGTMLDNLRQDFVFALRSLRRNPLFTLVALITIAVGVGATTTVFSVVNGVLLKPLPYGEPERLVRIYRTDVDRPEVRSVMAKADIGDVQGLPAFDASVGYRLRSDVLTGLGDAALVPVGRVTSGILDAFGLKPLMGRDLRWEESDPGHPDVVVVSHGFWTEELGQDPQVLGRRLELEGESFEVVGVAPAGFDYPDGARLWRPLVRDPEMCGRGCHNFWVIARMAPATTLMAARDQLRVLGEQLAEAYPDTNEKKRFAAFSLEEVTVGTVRSQLWILFGAVALVLLVACANVANLILARSQGRVGEVGVRAAMGASRSRLLVQVLTESLVLAGLGGMGGVALATGGVGLLRRFSAGALPRLEEVAVDGTVLLFTFGLVLLVALVFGLSPAFRLAHTSPSQALGRARQAGASGRRSGRARNMLLAGEVAFSLALLAGSGLLLKTLVELKDVDLGYEKNNVLRFDLSLPEARYAELPEIQGFFQELEEGLRALPGVTSVGSVYGAPMSSWGTSGGVLVEGRPDPGAPNRPGSFLRGVTPTYLETAGIPLLRGRALEPWDDASSAPVGLVNETFARQNFPGEDPLGKRVRVTATLGFGSPIWTIVGVVGDVQSTGITDRPSAEAYVPQSQMGPGSMTVLIRYADGAGELLPAVRARVEAMDPDLPLRSVTTVESLVVEELAPARFFLILLSVFAWVAVALAAAGLYGVVAHLVSGRRQEMGIRLALGARGDSLVRMVLRETARPTLVGMAMGLGAALVAGRILESFLYQVSPGDPLVLLLATLALVGVAFLASYIPARQASRVDPVRTLNAE
jgi:putative ABC transport system permease protein